MTPPRPSWRLLSAALLVTALAANFARYPLLDPDEGRNAEVAREMAASGNYVVPTLDGLPYADKPVLFFAAGALSIRILGATPLAARLPSLVFTALTLTLVGWWAHRRYGADGAWTAVLATGAAPLTLAFARTVIFDSALTLFVTGAVVAFAEAVEAKDRPDAAAWGWAAAGWAAIGLGILTKGPVALALPLLVMLPYAAWRGRWRVLFEPVGILLAVAIVAPWVMAMSDRVPGFLRYALVTETARRLTTPELHRTGPIWYFLPILFAGALPWSAVAVVGARRLGDAIKRREPDVVLLLLWILVPFVFFSLSQSKRPQYMLPLLPPMGLLVARLWRDCTGRLTAVRPAALVLATLGTALLLTRAWTGTLFHASPAVLAAVPATALAIGIACVVGGAVAFWLPARRHVVLAAFALPIAAIPLSSGRLLAAIGQERSAADLAHAIRPRVGPTTTVIAVGAFPLSLPFYLEHQVLLASADGRELTSNYIERWPGARLAAGSPLRPPDAWRDLVQACTHPVIVVVRQDDATDRGILAQVPLIAETPAFAAYGPCTRSNLALRAASLTPRRNAP